MTASLTIASLGADAQTIDGVGAVAAGPVDRRLRRALGRERALGAELLGKPAPPLDRLDAEHAAAGGAQDLDREQPEQAEADHDDPLAQRRLGAADALHGDRAERRERGVANRDAVRHGRDEVAGDRDDLGVVRAAGAGARDELTDREVRDAAGVDHPASARVAERRVVADRAADELDRVADAVLACVLQRLEHEVRVADGAHRKRAAAPCGRDG